MSLQYIIDGYNIIKHPWFARINKKIEDKESALLDFIRLNRLCPKSNNKTTVVFDGYPSLSKPHQYKTDIAVVFSRKDTADERIKKMVEASAAPGGIVVVSNDKEIVFFARAMGAKVVTTEAFIARAPIVQRLKASQDKKSQGQNEDSEPKISFSSMQKINQELRRIWLK
jgi:predicted RNA-binding protein with PIN domain